MQFFTDSHDRVGCRVYGSEIFGMTTYLLKMCSVRLHCVCIAKQQGRNQRQDGRKLNMHIIRIELPWVDST